MPWAVRRERVGMAADHNTWPQKVRQQDMFSLGEFVSLTGPYVFHFSLLFYENIQWNKISNIQRGKITNV